MNAIKSTIDVAAFGKSNLIARDVGVREIVVGGPSPLLNFIGNIINRSNLIHRYDYYKNDGKNERNITDSITECLILNHSSGLEYLIIEQNSLFIYFMKVN